MDTSFVTPNGAANIGLSAFQFANISQPVAADLKPTFRWFDQLNFGARDYIFAAPQNYVINPMSNYTRVGAVASTQLVKMLDGWALAYSVSVNTQDAIVAGQTLEMWFTPQWNMGNNATAPAKDVNLYCYFSNYTEDENTTSPYNETYSYVASYDFNSPTSYVMDITDDADYSRNNVAQFVSQTSVLVANATNATNTTAAKPATFW